MYFSYMSQKSSFFDSKTFMPWRFLAQLVRHPHGPRGERQQQTDQATPADASTNPNAPYNRLSAIVSICVQKKRDVPG